jgi:hypothetical protein
MEYILRNAILKDYFIEFSSKSFCLENLHFYDDALIYKSTQDVDKRKDLADTIIDKYLLSDSDEEINVEQFQIAFVVENKNIAPVNLFSTLENEILASLKRENYHKFVYHSQEFKEMLKDIDDVKFIDGKYYQKN